jgi:Na+/proline symporter
MTEFRISVVDWAVLVSYLAVVAAVGIVAARKIKTSGHYFLGGRRFNKWIMIGQSFGTGTHAEMPVSLAGAVYSVGASGIWFQWKNLFATPFYWLIAPLFRRFRRTTTAEVMEDRYGPWMGALYTVFALGFFTINMANMLKGAGKVIGQAAGGTVPVNGIVVAMTLVFITYSFIGGLVATAWTDFIQGFLIILLSFLLIPLGWDLVGGLAGVKQTLPAEKLSLATPHGITPWFIAVLTINGLIGIIAQPHLIAAVGTGKDEYACRNGQLYGNILKRFCTIGWAMIGLMVAVLVARGTFGVTSLADPEDAFGFGCRRLLFSGGLGLLIASILATNMAGCSAFMVDSGALFTNGFYRRYLVRDRPDRHYLRIGRISGVLITLAAVIYAVFFIERVLYSFLLTETMATYVGISVYTGLMWERANRWGALAGMIAAATANFALYAWRGQRLDAWDPGVFSIALGAGVAATVLVSLMTAPEPKERIRDFNARVNTPSEGPESAAVPREPDSAAVAKSGRQLIVTNLLRLRRAAAGYGWRAYRVDLQGFARAWLIVLGLVLLAWLVFHP